jgi:hypothetical protein
MSLAVSGYYSTGTLWETNTETNTETQCLGLHV